MSDQTDNPTPGDAQDLAAEALRAAQAAVSSLQTQTTETAAASGGDDAATAALLAAQQAIEAARSVNPPLNPAVSPPVAAPAFVPPPQAAPAGRPAGQPLNLPSFSPIAAAQKPEGIDLLSDVNLNVKIELGRTRMLVEDVLRLGEGSVVELDKLAGDPVDVFVNDRHVARGEVLVLNDNFCVRINEIIALVGEDSHKK